MKTWSKFSTFLQNLSYIEEGFIQKASQTVVVSFQFVCYTLREAVGGHFSPQKVTTTSVFILSLLYAAFVPGNTLK